ncbi:MAG: L-lactate dehydrogenase [Thermotogae bacterium]|nr:L-lactate dehydrogenase [Thermotogota bacterium]
MKVTIIGAGRVGTSIAFSLLHKEIANEMVIIDKNRDKAEGEALDLYHSTPMFNRCDVYTGDYSNVVDSDFIIITAGASQKPGETRLNLTKRNANIIKDIAANIREYSKNSIIVNVTNPVDVLTYILWRELKFPKERIIGTGTILDTARFRSLVSRQCNVSSASVHAYIIGEHGDSEMVLWSSASIGGVSIERFCSLCKSSDCTPLENIFEETKNAAYRIIERKGATNFAIGAVTATFVESIYKDKKRVWTASVFMDDLYIGFPAIIGKDGVERVVNVAMNEEERKAFENSKNIVRKYIEEVID